MTAGGKDKMERNQSVPSIHEITMIWGFGCPNKDVSTRYEPEAPAAIGLDPSMHLTTLIEAEAVLCGNEGRLSFAFETTTKSDLLPEALSAKVKKIVADQILPNITSGGTFVGRYNKKSDNSSRVARGFILKFSPTSGEPFTTTAARGFRKISEYFIGVKDLNDLPVPIISYKTFWQIGKLKIPFGIAIHLDTCMDGEFRKIRQVYRIKGVEAASRLYNRRLREISNTPNFFSKLVSDVAGAEIIVGRRYKFSDGQRMSNYQYCVSLIIDGYSYTNGKSSSNSSLISKAEEIAKYMRENGLSKYKLTEGMRLRYTTDERVPCEKLQGQDLRDFIYTLIKCGCHQIVE